MYKLVDKKINNSLALSWAIHIIQVSPQRQACSKSIERYHNSCSPQEK